MWFYISTAWFIILAVFFVMSLVRGYKDYKTKKQRLMGMMIDNMTKSEILLDYCKKYNIPYKSIRAIDSGKGFLLYEKQKIKLSKKDKKEMNDLLEQARRILDA